MNAICLWMHRVTNVYIFNGQQLIFFSQVKLNKVKLVVSIWQLLSCVIYKMSQKSEKYPSQFPKAQGHQIYCFVSPILKNPNIFSVQSHTTKKSTKSSQSRSWNKKMLCLFALRKKLKWFDGYQTSFRLIFCWSINRLVLAPVFMLQQTQKDKLASNMHKGTCKYITPLFNLQQL